MAVQAQYPLGRVVEDASEIVVDQSVTASHLFNANTSSANKMKRIRDADHHRSSKLTIPTRSARTGISHSLRRQRSEEEEEEEEIGALIRFHRGKFRARVGETGKRHCGELLSATARRIGDKEAELATAARKNADLESKMEEVAAQSRIWLNYANNTETAARGLKDALDRVLRHVSGDTESCCERPRSRRRSANAGCRVCRERDVSVLLLPCRHLCLCMECEPQVGACPVCNAKKNGGLQVLMG